MSQARADLLKTAIWRTLYGFEPTKAQLEAFNLNTIEDAVAWNGSNKNTRDRATEAYVTRDAEYYAAMNAVSVKERELIELKTKLHEAEQAKNRAWVVCEFVLGRK